MPDWEGMVTLDEIGSFEDDEVGKHLPYNILVSLIHVMCMCITG